MVQAQRSGLRIWVLSRKLSSLRGPTKEEIRDLRPPKGAKDVLRRDSR
jgi:hypothetical protein